MFVGSVWYVKTAQEYMMQLGANGLIPPTEITFHLSCITTDPERMNM